MLKSKNRSIASAEGPVKDDELENSMHVQLGLDIRNEVLAERKAEVVGVCLRRPQRHLLPHCGGRHDPHGEAASPNRRFPESA